MKSSSPFAFFAMKQFQSTGKEGAHGHHRKGGSAFYQHPAVRQRLLEFIGGDSLQHGTAAYLTNADGCPFDVRKLRTPTELDWLLERDMDIKVRQVEKDVRDLAERACVRIPLQEEGTDSLLEDYLGSRLRRFHEYYYSAQHDAKERWPETYDRTPLTTLPHCVRHLLEFPNDLLLKPAGIQLVTRTLLAQDWHPRHIAGLIRSKFENPNFGWGINWNDYEAATRADFYTRLFAGQFAAGLDPLVDFNCTSNREKGFCFASEKGCGNLESARQRLLSQIPS